MEAEGTIDITPVSWMKLAQIIIRDLERSDLSTRVYAIEFITMACTKLDEMKAAMPDPE